MNSLPASRLWSSPAAAGGLGVKTAHPEVGAWIQPLLRALRCDCVPATSLAWEAFFQTEPSPKPVSDEGASDRKRSHYFARSIINSLDAVIYTMDRDLLLTNVNSGWQKMPSEHGWLSLPGAPEAGRPFLDYVENGERREELRKILGAVLATGESREMQVSSPDRRHWAVKISPWIHSDEVIGLIYAVTDQTAVRELQAQLFHAQKMETIGTLAAGVAHDFNNLLQAVRGNVELLRMQTQMPPDLLPHLHQIEQAAKRAAEITRQLLSFSRSSSDSITVFDFDQFVPEALQLATRTLHRAIELRFNPAGIPLPVKMDATRAHQMLLNLCVNAQDAMPGGGALTITNAVVRIEADQAARVSLPAESEFVRCSVVDTGVGIPPEIQRRIFDAFFTTKCVGKGTGLGLSIVHCVATQAGGFIEVESAVGEGTAFHVYLPLVSAEVPAAEAPPSGLPRQGRGKVLVVDDEELIRQFNARGLRASGFEVVLAGNGEEALMRLLQDTEATIELMLTDYHMPRVNGIDLIQRARSVRPKLKSVLVSGYLDEATRARVEQSLGARILQKPYSVREAVDLIAELLEGKP
jgi:two-component system, cell cycle sensor histidine kinase and response regulator CckA